MKTLFATVLAVLLITSSCMTHRHTVGEGPIGVKGKTDVHSRAKQSYLFWGLIPLGRPSPHTPTDNNYQIKTGYNVGDFIISSLTGGIFSIRTVRILVHKEGASNNSPQVAFSVGDTVVFKDKDNDNMLEGSIIGLTGNKAIVRYKKNGNTLTNELSLSRLTRIEQ